MFLKPRLDCRPWRWHTYMRNQEKKSAIIHFSCLHGLSGLLVLLRWPTYSFILKIKPDGWFVFTVFLIGLIQFFSLTMTSLICNNISLDLERSSETRSTFNTWNQFIIFNLLNLSWTSEVNWPHLSKKLLVSQLLRLKTVHFEPLRIGPPSPDQVTLSRIAAAFDPVLRVFPSLCLPPHLHFIALQKRQNVHKLSLKNRMLCIKL